TVHWCPHHGITGDDGRTLANGVAGTHFLPDGTLYGEHGGTDNSAEQRERVEQVKEGAGKA
nr:hypothetical protein [Endozoicomonas sp.]